MPTLTLAEVLLRQREVDVDGAERLEHGDAPCPGFRYWPEVDRADAEAAGERRAHDLALDLRLERVDVGARAT